MVNNIFMETLVFFLKYFRNKDNWPGIMQTDNFLLKHSRLLELGPVILYFLKVMINH